MGNKLIVDAITGAVRQVALSVDEQAALQAAADAPPIVPAVVTMRQARLALFYAGLIDAVNAAVQKAPPPDQIWWEYSTDVHRNHPIVDEITKGLGMTPEQVDQLFVLAAQQP